MGIDGKTKLLHVRMWAAVLFGPRGNAPLSDFSHGMMVSCMNSPHHPPFFVCLFVVVVVVVVVVVAFNLVCTPLIIRSDKGHWLGQHAALVMQLKQLAWFYS